MCYKDEKQAKENAKLKEKLKDVPQFIKDYFIFLPSSGSKLNYWSNLKGLFEWLHTEDIVKNDTEHLTPEDFKCVTDINIMEYLGELQDGLNGSKISMATLKTKKNIFSSFFTYLVNKDYLTKNVVSMIPRNTYKVLEKEVHVPTEEEIESLISNLEGMKSEFASIRNQTIVKLLMGSGIRIDTLVGLDIDHLDLENGKIKVLEKGYIGEGNYKSILIGDMAASMLKTYLLIRSRLENIESTKALFVSERREDDGSRKRVEKITIQGFISKYSDGKISPHDFRHYCGTKMYESTNNLVNVQNQLGHADIHTTAKYYIKKNEDLMRKDLNSF